MYQAPFNYMVLRLGLENEMTSDISVAKKADLLGRIVVQRPPDPVDTLEGILALMEADTGMRSRARMPTQTIGGDVIPWSDIGTARRSPRPISRERKRKNSRTCVHRICTRPSSNYLISKNSLPNPSLG
jgi:hypothetical protein